MQIQILGLISNRNETEGNKEKKCCWNWKRLAANPTELCVERINPILSMNMRCEDILGIFN